MRPLFQIVWLLCLIPKILFAQVSNNPESGPVPQDGMERLALTFLKIDFTQDQRNILNNRPLEFIFFVDSAGYATLEDVNGIDDAVIMDSLMRRPIPRFIPKIVDGKATDGLFFMELEFPSYNLSYFPTMTQRPRTNIDDVDFERSGESFHILIGGVVNTFSGRPAQYLSTGGGFKLDLLWQTRSKVGYGVTMAAYSNKALEYYPINTTRKLDSAPSTFIIGAILSKEFTITAKRSLFAQVELAYAGQTVSSRENANDEEYIQLDGFSPGIVVNYSFRIGKEKFQHTSYYPSVYSPNLNIHGGIRPLLLDLKASRGVMFEIGISYRIKADLLSSYQIN
jgi:hypothetical protein